MDPSKGAVLQDQTAMGLRLSDGTQTTVVKQSLSPDIGVSTGRTKVMSLSASGRNFVISSNGKVNQMERADDVDESSSGYSSRESHYGENRGFRMKSQKSPLKTVYLVKEPEKALGFKDVTSKDDASLLDCCQNAGEVVGERRESPGAVNGSSLCNDTSSSLQERTETLEEVKAIGDDVEIEIHRQSCSTSSSRDDLAAFADSKKLYRQPRMHMEDDTVDHLSPDKTVGSDQLQTLSCRVDETKFFTNDKEIREVATQIDTTDHELFEECSNLRQLNLELEEKLKSSNDIFDVTIQRLEKQLNNAVSEITNLKSQLLSRELQNIPSSPCNRCGYCSDGEVTVLGKSSSNPHRDFTNVGSMKKADSTDCMSFRPKQQMVPVTQQPTLLKCIFKGANPDKIKMTLLERNKSLKNEIQNLKDKEQTDATATKTTLDRNQQSPDSFISHELIMDKRTTTEANVGCKSNEKWAFEDVRWKQHPVRMARRPKKSTANRSQFTSAAFRTIHVTKWGPQT